MATRTWNGGAGDNNFGTAGNWVGGVAPVGGDSVIFDSTSSASVTAGLATGISIVDFTVSPGYLGSIGTTSASITTTAITGTLTYAGGGPFFSFGCSGTVASAKFLHTASMAYITTGTYTILANSFGNLDVAAGVGAPATVHQTGTGVLTIAAGTAGTTLNAMAGTVRVARNFATVNCQSARVTITGTAASSTGINVYNGGVVNDQASGTVALVTAFPGGRYSLAGLNANKTITDRTQWSNGVIDDVSPPGVTVTFTNAKTVVGAPPPAAN